MVHYKYDDEEEEDDNDEIPLQKASGVSYKTNASPINQPTNQSISWHMKTIIRGKSDKFIF